MVARYTEGSDRREVLKSIAGGLGTLSVIGLAALGINGCTERRVEDTRRGYDDGRERLLGIVRGHYPGFTEGEALAVPPTSPVQALAAAEKALRCFGELLTVRNPFKSNTPLINGIEEAHAAPDSLMQPQSVKALPQYQEAAKTCLTVRTAFQASILASRDVLQDAQNRRSFADNPTAEQYLSTITPRLTILADRISTGRLMTAGNVIHTTNKFGKFEELIGQMDHYEEALAEIKAVRGILGRP